MKRRGKSSGQKPNGGQTNFEGGTPKNRKMKPPKKTKYSVSKHYYDDFDEEMDDLDLFEKDVDLEDLDDLDLLESDVDFDEDID